MKDSTTLTCTKGTDTLSVGLNPYKAPARKWPLEQAETEKAAYDIPGASELSGLLGPTPSMDNLTIGDDQLP